MTWRLALPFYAKQTSAAISAAPRNVVVLRHAFRFQNLEFHSYVNAQRFRVVASRASLFIVFRTCSLISVCRDSSVGIATRCGLDGPGSNPGVGEIFRTCPDRPWGQPSLLYSGYRVCFPGVKRPGNGVNHPPPSGAEVKETVELYLYSLSGPSWPVLRRTFRFYFYSLQRGLFNV